MKKFILCLCVLFVLGCGSFSTRAGDTAELGMHHTISTLYYIDKTGTVKTWAGKTVSLPDCAVELSACESGDSVFVVLEDGSVYAWGLNDDGQLGLGDYQNRDTPTKMSELENVISISTGRYGGTSAAVTSDGEVYIWGLVYCGDDAQYQPIMERYLTPHRVDGISNAYAVSVGGTGFAVLCSDGSVYTWGIDDGGSNGYGEHKSSAIPVKLSLPPVNSVSRGWTAAAAVTQDGKLYTWGTNENSILGRGSPFPYNRIEYTPDLVDIEPMRSVCIGRTFYISAIAQNGTVYQWGSTQYNDKSPTPITDSVTPKVLKKDANFVQVALGEGQSAGVTSDGKLYAWGYNLNGELGLDAAYIDYPTLAQDDAMVSGKLPSGSLENFSLKQRNYNDDTFIDVDEDAWYGKNKTGTIALAYEYAFINGTGNQKFSPNASLRISEAIRLVCSLQDRYAGGTGNFTDNGLWYQPYVHHAITVGIFQPGEFKDYNAEATRAEIAYLFAHALPETELKPLHNDVIIPDVSDSTPYAEEIEALYRAGILIGVDEDGSFSPDSTITRAEATAIFLRLAKPDMRIR